MLTRRSCRSIVRRRQNSPRDFNRIVPTILQDSQDSPGSNSSWDSSQWAPRISDANLFKVLAEST